MIDSSIFKAYDVRGIYPQEINEHAVYHIARAFAVFLRREKRRKRLRLAVSRDNRLSSPSLCASLIRGLREEGSDVIDIGLNPTPMFYFAVARHRLGGGIQVSASHNPPAYNGLKIVREEAIPVSSATGLMEIRELAMEGKFSERRKGSIHKKSVMKEYIDFQLKDFSLREFAPLTIVIDTANAVPGILVPHFFARLPCKVFPIFAKLDGRFPHHQPDPHVKRNLRYLQKEVQKRRADIGIAFDGDGDRVIFVDEKGNPIGGDLIGALVIEELLRRRPGEKIFYDLRSSNIVKEIIVARGGKVAIGRLGHSFIKEQMRRENILFGEEINGHYYLRDHYFCEAPFFVILTIWQIMSKTRKKLSELIAPLHKYFKSEELNFRVDNKESVLKKLEGLYRGGEVIRVDGIRIDFPEWWFSARPSHTENFLRLTIEAHKKEFLEEKKKELIALILGK